MWGLCLREIPLNNTAIFGETYFSCFIVHSVPFAWFKEFFFLIMKLQADFHEITTFYYSVAFSMFRLHLREQLKD